VLEIRQTDLYRSWFKALRDRTAKAQVDIRIRRLSIGNPGDVRPVGEGVSELRVNFGPGYRIYFIRRGDAYVVLLAGGDKSSQMRDILRAKELAREI
jgi:putative addiction module killer protein